MNFAKLLEAKRASLAGLTARRDALGQEADALLATAEAESRSSLNDDENKRMDEILTSRGELAEQIRTAERSIGDLEADQARDAEATRAAESRTPSGVSTPAARITSEPETYRRGGSKSFFRDLWNARTYNRRDALERLDRNNEERFAKTPELRAMSGSDGAGGEFVPPLWLLEDFEKLARAGRVTADQLQKQALPAGTDSISLPRITTGTKVAEQTTQNTALEDQDVVTDSVTASVATMGGKQVVSLQLVEQSPINIDSIVLADLAADHARATDVFVLTNNATGKKGLTEVTGINSVTYTSDTPAVTDYVKKLISAAAKIHTGRHLPAQKIFLHPDVWAWIISEQDSNKRPLVLPPTFGPNNALGLSEGATAEGLAGVITSLNLPVFLDGNIPTDTGTGSNETPGLVVRTDDVTLFEGTVKAEAFRETKAESLGVVFRLYNYIALMSERAPKGISAITGTGTITPTL